MLLIKKVTFSTCVSPHPWSDNPTCSLHIVRHEKRQIKNKALSFARYSKIRKYMILHIRPPWNTHHAVHGLFLSDNTVMNACKSRRFTIIIRTPPSSIISATKHKTCGSSVWSHILPLKIISHHYNDVIMGTIASQITSLTVVYSTVYSDADQRKHQSSASLAFV